MTGAPPTQRDKQTCLQTLPLEDSPPQSQRTTGAVDGVGEPGGYGPALLLIYHVHWDHTYNFSKPRLLPP